MARKEAAHWKGLFVFRGRTKTIHIVSAITEKEAWKHFRDIAKTRHYRLLKVYRGGY